MILTKTSDISTKFENWTEHVWLGNPALNLQARVKTFKYKNRSIQVWVFGLPNDYMYCVSAGGYSDLSHSGCFYPVNTATIEEYCKLVDEKNSAGKLIR